MPAQQGLYRILQLPVTGLLAWVLPGLGHVYIGQRVRGFVLMATIGLTFWGGVALGGVRSTVDPEQRVWWFLAQTCAGSHAMAAWGIGNRLRSDNSAGQTPAPHWSSLELAAVYTGVAGLLNLLVIFDALARGESLGAVGPEARAAPAGRGVT